MARIDKNGMQVDADFVAFIEQDALPGTGVSAEAFWAGLSTLAHDFGPRQHPCPATRPVQ